MKKGGTKSTIPSIDDLFASDDSPPPRKAATTPKSTARPAAGSRQKQSDADFYKSLAADASESEVSDADPDAVAKSLQGLDNLDDDLFGSLGKKKAPGPTGSSKPTTPASGGKASAASSDGSSRPSTAGKQAAIPAASALPATAAATSKGDATVSKQLAPKKLGLDELLAKPDTPEESDVGLSTLPARRSEAAKADESLPSRARSAPAARGAAAKKEQSIDFDEDDPLAGLLSDDEDESADLKKKAKGKKPTGRSSAPVVQPSHADRDAHAEAAVPPASVVERVSLNERPPTRSGSRVSSVDDDDDGSGEPLPVTPRQAKKKTATASLPDHPEADSAPPETANLKPTLKKAMKKEAPIDFDDDDDPLASLGLDDDGGRRQQQSLSRGSAAAAAELQDESGGARPASAFMDDLLGRRPLSADKPAQRRQQPAVTGSSGRATRSAPGSDQRHSRELANDLPPSNAEAVDDDDDLGFGAYMPSAVATTGSRPASQRSVRFEDEEADGLPTRRQSGLSRTIGGSNADDWLSSPSGKKRQQPQRPLGLSSTLGGPASADSSDDWLLLASGKSADSDDDIGIPRKAASSDQSHKKPPVPATTKAKSTPAASGSGDGATGSDFRSPAAAEASGSNSNSDGAKLSPTSPLSRRPSADGISGSQLAQQPAASPLPAGSTRKTGSFPFGEDAPSSDGSVRASEWPVKKSDDLPGENGSDDDWLGVRRRTGAVGAQRAQQPQPADDDGDWLSAALSSSRRRGSSGGGAGADDPTVAVAASGIGGSKVATSPATAVGTRSASPSMAVPRSSASTADADWLGVTFGGSPESSFSNKAQQSRRSRQPDEAGRAPAAGGLQAAASLPSAAAASAEVASTPAPANQQVLAFTTAMHGPANQQAVGSVFNQASARQQPAVARSPEPHLDPGKLQMPPSIPPHSSSAFGWQQPEKPLAASSREQLELNALWQQQQQAELQEQLKVQHEQGLSALRRQQELADLRQRQQERVQQQLIEHQRRMQEGVLLVQQQLQAAFDGSSMLMPPNVTAHMQNDLVLKHVELEGKIRKLEMEKEHLQGLTEASKLRHLEEMAALEASYKGRQQLADETYQRREARLKEENEVLAQQCMSRVKLLEEEKASHVMQHYRRLEEVEREKVTEMELMREQHRLALERMRSDHAEAMDRLKKAKDTEIEALSNAHARTNSFQFLVDQMKHNTSDLTSLQQRLQSQHSNMLDERELAARTRDEQLRVLQERLLMQQEENDKERTRLQELIIKMEVQLREQGRQLQEEQWKLSQEKNKVTALQTSLEEEKRIVTEELSRERNELRRAKENLLTEQKQILSQLYEERRALAEERSHFDASQRMLLEREHRDTLRHSQGAAEYEGLMRTVTDESAKLARRSQDVTKEEERLASERARLEVDKTRVAQEKETLSDLARRLRERSAEVEQMCQTALVARDEGANALARAQQVQSTHEQRLVSIQSRLQDLSAKEKQLAEERIALAKERGQASSGNSEVRCSACQGQLLHSSPVHGTPADHGYLRSSARRDQAVNLTNISIVRFGLQAELDQDYIEEEKMYLEALKHAPYHTTQKVA